MAAAGWDCHAHVIGDPDRFPLWSGRGYTPSIATLESYLATLDRHRLAHGVLIQPSVYGFDNRCMLDALDRAGGRLFGIAVPGPETSSRDLEAMHQRGVRGVRCNLINPGGLPPAVVIDWQPILHALGWHVELQVAIDELDDPAAFVASFGVPVVIDHMGRPSPGRVDPNTPSLSALIDLVRDEGCFVKLSAPYRLSSSRAPWPGVTPLARALVTANSRRCLWGSDWPHVDTTSDVRMEDLIDALSAWCGDPAVRTHVIEENPQLLFGESTGRSPRAGA